MKKHLSIFAGTVLLMAAAMIMARAAQDSTLDQKEVRNPRYLETWLEANAADAETRVAALESSTSVTAKVSGDMTVTSNLMVGGTCVATGNVAIGANKLVVTAATGNTVSSGTLTATGGVTSVGNLTVGANKFVVTAATGNTVISGTLTSTGTVTAVGNIALGGNLTATSAAAQIGLGTNTYITVSGTNIYFVQLSPPLTNVITGVAL